MLNSLWPSKGFILPLLIIASCVGAPFAWGHGAYHDKITELNQQLQNSPNDASLRFQLACAHQEHGEWVSAMVEIERVERLAPGRFQTGLVQGQALSGGGEWLTAKAVLDNFIKASPDHASALAERARVLSKLEQTEASLADYRAALDKALNPEPALFIEVADALAAHQALDEAAAVMRRSLTLHGAVPSLLLRSLDGEIAAKHFDEALLRVEAMRQAAPRPEPWITRRAQILTKAGRAAEAKNTWLGLRDHLLALPNLERGTPAMSQLLMEAYQALGTAAAAPVIAPPAVSATSPAATALSSSHAP